jgi:ubiquinone/menaquinone biosynthesis C-methylase UbiE
MKKIEKTADDKWPKLFPELTQEQRDISDDFMKYWHEVLPKNYGFIDKFNHQYVVNTREEIFKNTLEIGAGNGEHLKYEKISVDNLKNYVAIDIRKKMLDSLQQHFPNVTALLGDCQKRIEYPDGYFDRIIAIHVLEHLPNLPKAIEEFYRLASKDCLLQVVIPCEGGVLYSLCRKISAQRIFEKRYGQPYDWFIKREHINTPHEILEEIYPLFEKVNERYFPFPFIRNKDFNLCIGLNFRKRIKS